MELHALLASPPTITALARGGPATVQVNTGDYQFTIDSNTSRLIVSPAVLKPDNLHLTSGAPGADIAVAWNAGAGALSYIVQIHDNLGLRREFETAFLSAIYYAAEAVNDGGHKRTYTFRVASWNPSVGRSEFAELVVENAAPATPVVRVVPGSLGFTVSADNALEPDYAGMIVWAHTATGVPMDDAHKVYDDYAQSATFEWAASETAYFRVARYDTFGKADLNVSSEFSATKSAVAGLVQTDTLPGTTYLGDDVVYYTVGQEFYQWNPDAVPDPTYERAEPQVLNGQLYALDMKVISAAVGELKLGQMVMDAFGHIRGGQTDWDTGTGFWLGNYGPGDYRFSIGNSAGNHLTYENGNLVFSGDLSAAGGTFTGDLSAAGGTFTGDLSAAGGTFAGDLSAAGGTFAGALSAAGGTFTGDLSAAGGTFTGTLSGVDGTFSGTLTATNIVTTDQIVGGSVTTGYSSFTSGLYSFSSTSEVSVASVASVNIPSNATGANVSVDVSMQFQATSFTNTGTTTVKVKRDSTIIATYTINNYMANAPSGVTGYLPWSVQLTDTPGAAGNYTYSVTCTPSAYSGSLGVSNRNIQATVLKR